MKKTYFNPTMTIVKIQTAQMLADSKTTEGLQDFGGYGGQKNGGSADSRYFDFED